MYILFKNKQHLFYCLKYTDVICIVVAISLPSIITCISFGYIINNSKL